MPEQEFSMKFLSICITSYNRVSELERCLLSIDTKYKDEIEIVICEDCAPKREQVRDMVKQFSEKTQYDVVYHENINNLGFDRNLAMLISIAKGQYVLLMSDDDCFAPNCLDFVIESLEQKKPVYAYTSYEITANGLKKRKYDNLETIPKGLKTIAKHYDDSILFSGLIFDRKFASGFDAERFLNHNYFQVYLYLESAYLYDGLYIDVTLIKCMEDGENGYGSSASAVKNADLINRKSVFSNMEFNKGLIKVIKYFDSIHNTRVIDDLAKDYSLKSFYAFARAREISKNCLKEYWKRFNSLDINVYLVAKIYYRMLMLFGAKFCIAIMKLPRRMLFKAKGCKK